MSEQTQTKIEKTPLQQAMENEGAATPMELQKLQAAARGGYTHRVELPANFSEAYKAQILEMEEELIVTTKQSNELTEKLAKAQKRKVELDARIVELTDILDVIRKQNAPNANRSYLAAQLAGYEDRIKSANHLRQVLEKAGLDESIVDMSALGVGPSPLDAAIKHKSNMRRQKANAEALANIPARR